eukprot:g8540.t1
MEKLIDSLLGSVDAEAFRDPVDWRGLGLHDYPHIIKRPMDLGTVKLRLERGAYPTAEACAADVRLIWENCRTYNTGGVPRNLHKAADALSKRFEARFAKMPAGGRLKVAAKGDGGKRTKGGGTGKTGAVDAPPTPTNEDRRRLARHLGRARMEDVTAAVHEIDRRCPTALVLKRAQQREGEKGDDGSADGDGGGGGGGGGGSDGGDDLAILTGTAAVEIEVDVDELDPWTFCAVERAVGLSSASRRAKSKRPAAGASAAASSSSGKSSRGGFRHRHQRQERGRGGATVAAAGVVGVKGDIGDRGGAAGAAGAAGTVVGEGAGAGAAAAAGAAAGARVGTEVRPYKKPKVGEEASL